MQGTQVWPLVREDPTCHGATKPVCHNYWDCALEPASHNYWVCTPLLLKPVSSRAHMPQLLSPRAATTEAHTPRAYGLQREATAMRSLRTATKSSPRSPQLGKVHTQQQRLSVAKKKKKQIKKNHVFKSILLIQKPKLLGLPWWRSGWESEQKPDY